MMMTSRLSEQIITAAAVFDRHAARHVCILVDLGLLVRDVHRHHLDSSSSPALWIAEVRLYHMTISRLRPKEVTKIVTQLYVMYNFSLAYFQINSWATVSGFRYKYELKQFFRPTIINLMLEVRFQGRLTSWERNMCTLINYTKQCNILNF